MLLTLLLAAVAPQGAGTQDLPLTLFDGRSLAGWGGDPRFWTVEQGALVGRSTADNPCRETTYLVHEPLPFEHFELSLEVQLDGGNTGVQFRSRDLGGFQVVGPQADHDASGDWTGGLYEQGGRGVLVRRGTALDLATSAESRAEALGDPRELLEVATASDWDRLTVRCVGPVTEIRWNGVLTAKLADGGPGAWRIGQTIALQLHAGPPMEVRFRAVTLTPLAAPEAAATPAQASAAPQWIWPAKGGDAATLRRRVEPRGQVVRAVLWGACDNGVEVFAGARRIAVADDWSRPFERDVTGELGAGPFELVARCWNEGGPAALVLRLALEYADGTTELVVTDGDWRADGADGAASSEPVQVLGPFGVAPWGAPATAHDGSPRGVLDPAKLVLPAGFEAALVHEVPRQDGSWVAVTCDDRGRIYAADERSRGVFRLTERPGAEPLVEALPLGLPAAQGLCAVRRGAGLDLYVMVNAYGSDKANGLWRARDTEDDGAFEAVELLMEIQEGAGEHGAHGIIPAPDGSGLYVISGNHTRLPADIATYHAPRVWQEDQLIPPLPDPNGHAVGIPVPGGWFLKTDFDGGRRELVAIGMRNAYDVALDREGNPLTYDSDMEWDMGAPWYRAPRILQLVPGADFGWRNGSGKVPEWAEETLGSVVDTGPASPTGVLHTKDLAFHAPWDDVLLAADWAYGTVHAVSTTRAEDGAALTGTIRPFLSGKPFPVTDLAAHPDGSLIVTIGGRGTRSAVYRVRSQAGVDPRATTAVPDPVPAARPGDPADLGSADRVARLRARNTLIARGAGDPQALAPLDPTEPDARTSAGSRELRAAARLVAAALTADEGRAGDVLRAVAALDLASLSSRPARLAALRAAEITLARHRGTEAAQRDALLARLEPLYPSGDRALDRGLATLLVGLDSAAFTPRAVARLVTADTQEEALFLAYALRVHEAGWTPALVDTYLTFLHVDAARFHGGHSLGRYVEVIREEATARLGAGWTPPPAVSQSTTAPPIAASIFVKEWTLRDLRPTADELTGRDLARGRHVFQAARCAECHRFAGAGGSTGPDLTGAGSRYSAEDLLLAILEPSRDLTDQYQDTEVWTTDGIVHMGRVVEEDAEWLTLMPPPPNEADRLDVAKAEVKLRRPHPISRMPGGLLNGFRREEALDLVAYLLGGAMPGAPATGAPSGSAAGGDDEACATEAELHAPDQPGLATLQRAFAAANPGYRLEWLPSGGATCAPDGAAAFVFVQQGEGAALVTGPEATATSPARPGDLVVLRRGEVASLQGIAALVIHVPAPPPPDVPTFVRPDFDPRITDTPGGCAEEADAYRRILLTWQGKTGPYLFHALNAHRVRVMDSFTHYHPVDGGFDELYLVQSAPAGAELIVSERLDVIRGVAAVTKADAPNLIRRIPLAAGDLVYLPRGVVHRGVGGAVVQVITVPGFVPGAELGVDAELAALNERLGLSDAEALPVHQPKR